MKKALVVGFRKTYGVFSLARHAILEITNSVQLNTLLGYLNGRLKNIDLRGMEIFYEWPDVIQDIGSVEDEISDFQPDIVAVSLFNVDFGAYLRLRKRVDRITKRKITWLAGGYLPTCQPDEVLRQGQFDYLIRGHGEEPFYRFLSAVASGKNVTSATPNLTWLEKGRLKQRAMKSFQERESSTKLRFEPFSVENYVKESWQIPPVGDMRYLTTWFSRGCPYKCGFCLNPLMNRGQLLVRDPDLVLDEIFQMNAKAGINYVFFADENFLIDKSAVRRLLKRMIQRRFKSRVRYTFMTGAPEIARGDGSLLDQLRESGCEEIQFGVESGSRSLLRIMNKASSPDLCIEAFEKTSAAGIMAQAMLVLGYEGETVQSLEETKAFIRKLRPDRVSYFYAIPFPGTPVFRRLPPEGAESLPLYFFDSDFPVFPVRSLEKQLREAGETPEFYIDPAVERILRKHRFSFSPSQLFLLAYREKLMYDYYVSDAFFEKQREVFESRIMRYGEDPATLLRGARQWFQILEKSIESKDYAKTMLQFIHRGDGDGTSRQTNVVVGARVQQKARRDQNRSRAGIS